MKSTRLLSLVVALFLAGVAHSQVISAYVLSDNTHVSNVQTGSVYTNGTYTNQYTSFFASGIGGGVTFGIIPLGPVRLGFDLRGSTKPGTSGVDTGMAGLKLGLKVPLVKPRPYVQVSGGYLGTRSPNVTTVASGGTTTVGGTYTNRYAAYEILGGVDFPLLPLVDFRIEGGGGHGFNTFGSGSGNNSVNFFNINPGIVVRF